MDQQRIERVRNIGREHARVETEGDLAATMATLVDDPLYEFQPVGLLLRGRAGVERYYKHLMEHFLPRVESAGIVDEWCNENALAQEYDVKLRIDGEVEEHRLVGVLVVGEEKLPGRTHLWERACPAPDARCTLRRTRAALA